jgi:uncharacterized membrane protein
MRMKVRAAVTINRSEEEITSRLVQAESPLSDDDAQISYAPAPGGRGTEVRVVLDKSVIGGAVGQKVAAVAGIDPQRQLDDALRRFKQIVETGEVVISDGSPAGTEAPRQRAQEPAQPSGSNAR